MHKIYKHNTNINEQDTVKNQNQQSITQSKINQSNKVNKHQFKQRNQ